MSQGVKPVTVLVAEDEAPQRAELLDMLDDAWPGIEVVAACEDGITAMQAIVEHRPQVAFLDIRMPGVGGLDVAKAAVASGAHVVFTTAYDEYAIRAFEAGAIDYLPKPIQPARLDQAVQRLRARLLEPGGGMRTGIDALEARLRPAGERLIRWISASAGDSVRMIGIDEVVYFQARDKYVSVVVADGEATIRMPIKDLLAGLDPDTFWQVHRGIVVRVSAIDRMQKDELGKPGIRLRGRSDWLPVSAAFLHRFRGM
jgi:DNA-binding LytR/AlgR family response regulator